jgi:hypothetical protein
MKVFIETIDEKDVKKFIHEISEQNGHDCWGNYEWSSYDVVYIDGKEERISKGGYIAHDGEKVIYTGSISSLPNAIGEILDPKLSEERKEKRYKEYLKNKKEFEIKSDENKRVIRDVNIQDKII